MSALSIVLPITVEVTERGHVTVSAMVLGPDDENRTTRVVAMSPFSERATRLARDFGTGTHVVTGTEDLPADSTYTDLAGALS